jgi:ubiquinone/menaquinone biosynthesis C-methylase UbiE
MKPHRWTDRPEPKPGAGVDNPFVGREVACRYASARPVLHHHVTQLLADRIPRPPRALDLGCGTGLSTAALQGFARLVVGVDVSSQMLAARTDHSAMYVLAQAERLPFADAVFELVTIASAIHWFGPEAIHELGRVLGPSGWLVVYDVWFRGEMVGADEFAEWMRGEASSRYRPVPKHQYSASTLATAGLSVAWEADLTYEVEMSQDELINYLMTHSERIAAVRDGRETESEQRRFLSKGIVPFYRDARSRRLAFGIEVEAFSHDAASTEQPRPAPWYGTSADHE